MQVLRHKSFSLAALGLFTGFSAGCDPADSAERLCGPCGSIATGSLSIANNARVDGFFTAVADVGNVFANVRGDFNANIRALAEVWGYAGIDANTEITADVVGELMAHIEGEISASIEGGITIDYAPPRCTANVSVAVEAQASCEAQAECDVEADPGSVSVECEGQCSGGCEGSCEGSVACQVEGGISCEGSCEGSCELEAAASCEGTCRGSCTANGNTEEGFDGACMGMCEGTCEVSAGASCSGTCHGTCVTEAPSAECMATAECRGSCDGSCSGSCQGEATPPSASADCEASADCQASASAQASANVECSPPSLDIRFEFAGGLDANAQAQFVARIGELRVRGAAIFQGFAQLRGLVDGDFDGDGMLDAGLNATPIANIGAQFDALVTAAVSGEIDIPVGRLPCLVPAFEAAIDILTDVTAEAGATLSAQAEFSTSLIGIAS